MTDEQPPYHDTNAAFKHTLFWMIEAGIIPAKIYYDHDYPSDATKTRGQLEHEIKTNPGGHWTGTIRHAANAAWCLSDGKLDEAAQHCRSALSGILGQFVPNGGRRE